MIAQTEDLTLLTDGERRHGNFLIEKCFALAAAQFFARILRPRWFRLLLWAT